MTEPNGEVTPEAKTKILEMELTLWRNTLYQATVRMRVAKKAENKEIEAAAIKDAESAQRMIDGYEAELATVNGG